MSRDFAWHVYVCMPWICLAFLCIQLLEAFTCPGTELLHALCFLKLSLLLLASTWNRVAGLLPYNHLWSAYVMPYLVFLQRVQYFFFMCKKWLTWHYTVKYFVHIRNLVVDTHWAENVASRNRFSVSYASGLKHGMTTCFGIVTPWYYLILSHAYFSYFQTKL